MLAGVSTLILALFVLRNAAAGGSEQLPIGVPRRPNIVFILTDDQDLHMDSLSYMHYLKKHITDQGTFYRRHFCTVALCCPSRASMWTGRAAHNTNITDLNPPYGGYPKFVSEGFNDDYLPIWLQAAGYNTYYVGKFLNAQRVTNYDSPHAAGWTGSDFLLDPFTYEYYNSTFQRNHDLPVSYEGQYSTDVVASKAHGFLDDAIEAGAPFMLTVAPIAPHSNVHKTGKKFDGKYNPDTATQSPPRPAERHKDLFQDVVVPRTPHFNPDKPNGVNWILELPHQNETNIEYNDEWYRNRLRTLQAVDEMIDSIVTRLDEAGVTDNTYIIFSTDNGYHVGQHRLQPGKQCAYEEDVNIPFIVRGPGVPRNHTTDVVTSHTDVAPTFLDIAEAPMRDSLDGVAIPLTEGQLEAAASSKERQEHVNVEMWGIILSEGIHGYDLHHNHTYKALRVVGKEFNLLYTVWCSGEHELYDLNRDPYQMKNLYSSDQSASFSFFTSGEFEFTATNELPSTSDPTAYSPANSSLSSIPRTLEHLLTRLDTLLMELKTCKGRQCTEPWKFIHPDGGVSCLLDALDPYYDEFYANQERVRWTKCEEAYIKESEGPMDVVPFMVHEVAV